MDLHELHSLIAGKPSISDASNPAPFIGQHQSFMDAGPEWYGMVVMSSTGGEVDLLPPPGMESFGFLETAGGGGGGGQGRWLRQETLTLLEVRSRMDSKFREAARKGPLWDEVSRIMAEEHGYQRSGKKCRDKLENLYKYYRKTKERKAGRQDGKQYRFFRQLEALYGGSSNAITEINQPCTKATKAPTLQPFWASKLSGKLSLSSSSEFNESLSKEVEEEDESTGKLKLGRKNWKSRLEEFIDAQVKRFIEVQETWMDQMLKTLEHMEHARISREEDWRKQEAARFDREHSVLTSERDWIEARDAAIIETLEKMNRHDERKPHSQVDSPSSDRDGNVGHGNEINGNAADSNSSMTQRREEISAAMACLGRDRSAKRCKEEYWDDINKCSKKSKDSSKKRRMNNHLEALCGAPSGGHEDREQGPHVVGFGLTDGPSPSSYDAGVNGINESSFFFSVSEEASLWENNGVRHGGQEAC